MNILRNRAKEFTPPKPTFVISSPNNKNLVFDACDRFRPRTDGDTIYNLLASHYRAEFSTKQQCFKINHEAIASNAGEEILNDLMTFFERNSPLRNPRQGKTHRWLKYSSRSNDTIMDGLTLVWDYMVQHKDDMSDHRENILELLEQIRSRHEAIDPQAH